MPAALTNTDYLIIGEACLGMAKHHRSDGEYRDALRYAVTGLKILAYIEGFNGTAESFHVDLCDLIEACSARKKGEPDAVLQDPPAAGA